MYTKKSTPYGGKGIYATMAIPKDTLVLTSDSPFASVVYRVFRKEVCARCFAYAFDANRSTWNIRHDGSGVWFCSTACKESWIPDQNVDGLWTVANSALDKLAQRLAKIHYLEPTPSLLHCDNISSSFVDQAWSQAESKHFLANKFEPLSEAELDTARFMLCGIIRIYSTQGDVNLALSEVLELQDNELELAKHFPHTLESHLRIYAVLRKIAPPALKCYVTTSSTVRSVLARDSGNTFGLFDKEEKDGEMLGYAMYPNGSYFNHDCSPNIRKERVGRSMLFYTTRDINIDEELCTNYIDIKDSVLLRRKQLANHWYFDCECKRCTDELKSLEI